MKKKIVVFGCVLCLFAGCGNREADHPDFAAEPIPETVQDPVQESAEKADPAIQQKPAQEDFTDNGSEVKEESVQEEIAKVEAESCKYENADWDKLPQQEMNQLTAQWYRLWDDELNSLWGRLKDELDAETWAKLLDEQRAWIKRKEQNVNGAGALAYGGSLQPQLENSVAEEMTRARAYILAGYLADARNEAFTISSEIQASIENVEPNLEDVFAKFEGQWIFDGERGACVGVERTEKCAYGVDGSNWTVWETGGDIISDLDIYGYTEDSIIFKTARDSYDAFYELSFNIEGSIIFAYGTSLYEMDDVIICN